MIFSPILFATAVALPDTRCLSRSDCPTANQVRNAVIGFHGEDGEFLRTHDEDAKIRELRRPRQPDVACRKGQVENTAVCGFVVFWRARVEASSCHHATAAGALETINCPGGSSINREVHYIANFQKTDDSWQITSADYVVGS